ncbi:MAG TPA: MarR family transcriptional regulator [Acidobacteriaceae bacterium]|nr:MarR family transcriptional regulator [Acidobacteriaceae bacterium]
MKQSGPKASQSTLLLALAEFRYALRSFLRFSEQAAQDRGLQPRQHQLLLQIAGLPAGRQATIGFLAERLGLRQNSVVELADRSVAEGLVRRTEDAVDRRRVVLSLTRKGARVLDTLSDSHAREFDEFGPRLILALEQIENARANAAGKSGAQRRPANKTSKPRNTDTNKRAAQPASGGQ